MRYTLALHRRSVQSHSSPCILTAPTLYALALTLGIWSCSPAALEPIPAVPGSHVVLIVVDTLRADALGKQATPRLEELAQDGVRFGQSFSHAPSTLPAHTALFSSRAPHQSGVLNNGADVPVGLPLLAEHLQAQGYGTHAVVSLGTLDPRAAADNPGLARGFEHYDMGYWLMDAAPGALRRLRACLDGLDRSKPFFLFAHFSDPHAPYSSHASAVLSARVLVDGVQLEQVPTSLLAPRQVEIRLEAGEHEIAFESDSNFEVMSSELWRGEQKLASQWIDPQPDKYGKTHRMRVSVSEPGTYRFKFWLSQEVSRADIPAFYRSEVEFMDQHVGLFLDELRERDLYNESLLIFTSDHGEGLGNPGHIGHIQNLREMMLHVPLIIKLPDSHLGRKRLQAQSARLIPHWDLSPTLLDIIGLAPLPGAQGTSLLQSHEALLIAETHRPEARRDSVGIRDETYKMVYAPENDRYFMFDLKADPSELKDIFESHRSKRSAWPDQLKQIAMEADQFAADARELTEDEKSDLGALGYAGDEED
jgi:arylsulfatase A-like enzyme